MSKREVTVPNKENIFEGEEGEEGEGEVDSSTPRRSAGSGQRACAVPMEHDADSATLQPLRVPIRYNTMGSREGIGLRGEEEGAEDLSPEISKRITNKITILTKNK